MVLLAGVLIFYSNYIYTRPMSDLHGLVVVL